MEIDMELKSFIVLYDGKFIRVYKENEADKVIAEKDEEITELKEQVHDYAQGLYVMQARAEKEARHHKFKRCLAMARMCEERSARYDVLQERHDLDWGREIEFYYRWYMRWLELAEKFKPNSTATKENNNG